MFTSLHRLSGHCAEPTLQAKGVNRRLLVDGQQRLTTLMLALADPRSHQQQWRGRR